MSAREMSEEEKAAKRKELLDSLMGDRNPRGIPTAGFVVRTGQRAARSRAALC